MPATAPSIQSRMTAQILIGTAILLLLSSAFVAILFHQRITSEFDDALEARADALRSLLDLDNNLLDFDFNEDAMPEFQACGEGGEDEEDEDEENDDNDEDDWDEAAFFEWRLPDGTSLRKSPSLGNGSLPPTRTSRESAEEEQFWNGTLPNGQAGRYLQVEFVPEIEEEEEEEEEESDEDPDHIPLPPGTDLDSLRVVLIVGRPRGDLLETLGLMYGSLAVLVVIVLVGIAFVVRRAFKTGFRPVRDLNSQLQAIGPECLADRISLETPREELATIESSVNQLLERVAAGFERERRFSSNVAHELRTPVSELRSACEVGGRWPDDPEEVKALFQDIHSVGIHMEKIVEILLTLARCENGTMPVESEHIDLRALLDACRKRSAAGAAERGVRLNLDSDEGLSLLSDANKLQMIFQNLLDNAVAHSTPDTTVDCIARKEDDRLVVTLTNQPADLVSDDIPRLFERCWQKHPTASDRQHAGLGLSIARALADLLEIRIKPRLKSDGTFEVRVVLDEPAT